MKYTSESIDKHTHTQTLSTFEKEKRKKKEQNIQQYLGLCC